MAALPYIQFYVADYLADTAHLTTVEHGAYLLLIFNYWQRGESLKAKDEQTLNKRLASVARLSNDEWDSVRTTLEEFFIVSDTEWFHERIDRDLEAVSAKATKASNAGKASGSKRREKNKSTSTEKQSLNECSTGVQQTLNHTDTDTDTDTEEEKTKRVPRFDAQAHLMSLGIPAELSADWITLRKAKKAEVTKTAIDGVAEEAAKAGIAIEAALRECCTRGWAGFKASWLARDSANQRGSPVIPLEARNKAVADKWVPPEMRVQA